MTDPRITAIAVALSVALRKAFPANYMKPDDLVDDAALILDSLDGWTLVPAETCTSPGVALERLSKRTYDLDAQAALMEIRRLQEVVLTGVRDNDD